MMSALGELEEDLAANRTEAECNEFRWASQEELEQGGEDVIGPDALHGYAASSRAEQRVPHVRYSAASKPPRTHVANGSVGILPLPVSFRTVRFWCPRVDQLHDPVHIMERVRCASRHCRGKSP